MLTDPVADMLTRIRNANKALHERVEMPASKLKVEIARILKEEGYVRDYHVVETGDALRRARDRAQVRPQPRARAHRPQARLQAGPPHLRRKDRLPRVLGGMGIAILSTSRGLITCRTAEREGIGGEVDLLRLVIAA